MNYVFFGSCIMEAGMQIGKVPANILKRSVTNMIGRGPGVGIDCGKVDLDGSGLLCSTEVGTYAVYKAANNIWASGGELLGVSAAFMMKANAREIALKRLTARILDECRRCGTKLLGGHTEVTDRVTDNYVTVTAMGKGSGVDYSVRSISGDEDIVVTKWIGIESAALLLADADARAQIDGRFSSEYIEPVLDASCWIPIEDEARIATGERDNVVAMHDISDGGIFGALWELCMGAGCGIEIELSAIPIRQEISEIHTYFGIDIYRARSAGSLIIACRDGAKLCERFECAGINASVIGHFTKNHDKIIHSHDEIRYLNEK